MEAGFALLLAKSYKEARAIVGNWKEGGKVVDALERLAQARVKNLEHYMMQEKNKEDLRILPESKDMKKGKALV